ncbi:SRPBCC family protein [Cellulomonas xylanilytica]|uniref:Polyketide cyclase n=1 Tax=Cellulomonas xylanilytica TaxID=233583 RepID=A0A510V885_9CELL|nr:SRPBCC family protein [Cellulomonas xylanilytica]GEK23064.1 hypothetical protein CXY01_35840 [Cellulomonas xylanilytica]
MGAVTVTTEVARSAQEVFTYATDPTTFHEWQDGVRSGHMDRPGVPVPGAVCTTTRRIGFTDRTSHSVVTHVDPPARWGTRGDDGPIRAVVDVTVEALGPERSRLTISVDFTGHGIGTLLVPLAVRPAARKEMPGNLAALKKRLESAPR